MAALKPARVRLACPRCGLKKTVSGSDFKHVNLCPRCGAGLREARSS